MLYSVFEEELNVQNGDYIYHTTFMDFLIPQCCFLARFGFIRFILASFVGVLGLVTSCDIYIRICTIVL
jgi:hypothetical protein